MATFVWPSEDGWPYPDADLDRHDELVDEQDDDLLSLRAAPGRMLGRLNAVERQVITARFGLDGKGARSFEQIQVTTGPGLAKLRTQLR
jgi:hypothetical protein